MIHADSGQIQNAILNLAFQCTGCHAGWGKLSFETSVKELDDTYCQNLPCEVVPGTSLCLSVTDAGTGIAPDVLPRIFDPFFTTKDVGEGMGMGLATAYGTIKSHIGEQFQCNSEQIRHYLPGDAFLKPMSLTLCIQR